MSKEERWVKRDINPSWIELERAREWLKIAKDELEVLKSQTPLGRKLQALETQFNKIRRQFTVQEDQTIGDEYRRLEIAYLKVEHEWFNLNDKHIVRIAVLLAQDNFNRAVEVAKNERDLEMAKVIIKEPA